MRRTIVRPQKAPVQHVEDEQTRYERRTNDGRVVYPSFKIPKKTPQISALKRLMRDLAEFQGEDILTVGACPQEDNIFEWHVNIKAPDGVYAGTYLHCVMTFTKDYPKQPPKISCSTPIAHPNLFSGGYICLSMLTSYGSHRHDNFEGWSTAYSATSILRQLQSFFFAEQIRQDYGGNVSAEAYLDHGQVKRSLERCRTFRCPGCGHTAQRPFPPVPIDAMQSDLTVQMRGCSNGVSVDGTNIQTLVQTWVGAYAEQSVNEGRVQYEVLVKWTGDEWRRDNITGGLCRFGWGTSDSSRCGLRGDYSVGYGGTAKISYDGQFEDFGLPFTKGDTITCAVDFEENAFWFGKNGRLINESIPIPRGMAGYELYPLASFKNARAEFNFGRPKTPVPELQSFAPLGLHLDWENEQDAEQDADPFDGWTDLHDDCTSVLLKFLDSVSMYCASWTNKRWHSVFTRFGLSAQREIRCFHTKIAYSDCILGFGLMRDERGQFSSQMDYLSLVAWDGGVREGVWGSQLNKFIPLVINTKHGKRAYPKILKALSEPVGRDRRVNRGLFIAKVMNDIVVNLARAAVDVGNAGGAAMYVCGVCKRDIESFARCDNCGNTWRNVPAVRKVPRMEMNVSEKALLGYASFYHMLLLLVQNDDETRRYAQSVVKKLIANRLTKADTPDLGQALVFLSVVDGASWPVIAKNFTAEVWTRNVRWFTQDNRGWNRSSPQNFKDIFRATAVSRCVVMFQVLFSRLVCTGESARDQLTKYNQRMGRPEQRMIVKLHAFCRKFVNLTRNDGWSDQYAFYWKTLGFLPLHEADFINFLKYSVARSAELRYHKPGQISLPRVVGLKTDLLLQLMDEFRPRGGRRDAPGVQSQGKQTVGRRWNEDSAGFGGRGGRGRGRGRGRGNNRGRGGRGGGNSSWDAGRPNFFGGPSRPAAPQNAGRSQARYGQQNSQRRNNRRGRRQ